MVYSNYVKSAMDKFRMILKTTVRVSKYHINIESIDRGQVTGKMAILSFDDGFALHIYHNLLSEHDLLSRGSEWANHTANLSLDHECI